MESQKKSDILQEAAKIWNFYEE